MTYCLGLMLDQGLVFASDSRTNAGVDYVTSYSKMYVFHPAPDRVFVLLSAGNLATTQQVMNRIQRDLDAPGEGRSLATVSYLFEAAEYVGHTSVKAQQEHGSTLQQSGISGETTLILGGQIQGRPHGLMLIYPQGNSITASPETPYLQIGENKYGKPVLDRVAHPGLALEDAARLALVSLDATARSNVTVGPPFEVAIYRGNSLCINERLKFQQDDPLYQQTQSRWQQGLLDAFYSLPKFPWETPSM